MINSKDKGSNFERDIANKFSVRFEDYLGIKQGFRRNIDSGSFFGGNNSVRVDTYNKEHMNFGDILTPSNFRFVIECKAYKDQPQLLSIIEENNSFFDKWIIQSGMDSKNSGKLSLIIIKYNYCKPIVLNKIIPSNVKYKNYYIDTLDNILDLPNNIFFEKGE